MNYQEFFREYVEFLGYYTDMRLQKGSLAKAEIAVGNALTGKQTYPRCVAREKGNRKPVSTL